MADIIPASAFHLQPDLLDIYELLVNGTWRSFTETDVYRMPNSPILFYSDFPDGEVSVPRNELIEVRLKRK